MNTFLWQNTTAFPGIDRVNKLAGELTGKQQTHGLLPSLRKIHDIRNSSDHVPSILNDVIAYFDNSQQLYQFLDKPNRILFFDAVINQLSYPMHYAADMATRLTYIAKRNECLQIYYYLTSVDIYMIGYQLFIRFQKHFLIQVGNILFALDLTD